MKIFFEIQRSINTSHLYTPCNNGMLARAVDHFLLVILRKVTVGWVEEGDEVALLEPVDGVEVVVKIIFGEIASGKNVKMGSVSVATNKCSSDGIGLVKDSASGAGCCVIPPVYLAVISKSIN
jgi:hypothetical protein